MYKSTSKITQTRKLKNQVYKETYYTQEAKCNIICESCAKPVKRKINLKKIINYEIVKTKRTLKKNKKCGICKNKRILIPVKKDEEEKLFEILGQEELQTRKIATQITLDNTKNKNRDGKEEEGNIEIKTEEIDLSDDIMDYLDAIIEELNENGIIDENLPILDADDLAFLDDIIKNEEIENNNQQQDEKVQEKIEIKGEIEYKTRYLPCNHETEYSYTSIWIENCPICGMGFRDTEIIITY